MKYAFYPGCVSRGACPELYAATIEVCKRLGIELEIEALRGASCTGSGVLQEKNLRLADTLNARTFAMAERTGLPLMTICSTCQGVMSQANQRLKEDSAYLAEINADLAEEGLEYKGTADPRHLLWILIEEHRPGQAQVAGGPAAHRVQAGALLRLLHRPAVRRARLR